MCLLLIRELSFATSLILLHVNREKEQASKFLSLIPHKTLALASLRCKDYTRAFMHYEKYLRYGY